MVLMKADLSLVNHALQEVLKDTSVDVFGFIGANVSTHTHSVESCTSSQCGAKAGRCLVGDPDSDLISKAKKKPDNIFYHSFAHTSHAVTCSLCNLLYYFFFFHPACLFKQQLVGTVR